MMILTHTVTRGELSEIAKNSFGDMVKCVADIVNDKLAIDAGLHSDLEKLLLEDGSDGKNLWGFNLWVEETGDKFIEYDSLINIRSWQGNPTRGILDESVRSAIREIVSKYVR